EYNICHGTLHRRILGVIDTSYTIVHSEGRYYPDNSIVNMTVLLVQAYFLKSSTKDIVVLRKAHNGR
ncbi:hypothetical protein C922_03299, partial [Plasmodium inui San Antonio 1]